jgi:uncharacterized protein YdiU (UPF0061 family)
MRAPDFDNTYARLPERFFARLDPTPVARPRLLALNAGLARDLGLDPEWLASEAGVAMLCGNGMPPGAMPIAQAYAGHQFGGFSPRLGDGRAILIGEVVDPRGMRRDIQLKGSGPTPFSRRGDGRAALGPVLREYIVAEAMHALGLPTTRALAVVATGEPVFRETVQPGGILTRVAASHIRIGTFQYFAAQGDVEALRTLTDYAIARHAPEAANAERPAIALLQTVIARQARLIAAWLGVGFIHGVMNTDNMTISGETIDYGPCAFMDTYDPAQVYSSIDAHGRYAYANQPGIALWNLARFAETLLPLIDEDETRAIDAAQTALASFAPAFETAHATLFAAKIGIDTSPTADDAALVKELLEAMAAGRADYTLTFRRLTEAAENPAGTAKVVALFADPARIAPWLERWETRLSASPTPAAVRAAAMRKVNPALIPRNHRVEEALAAATTDGDLRHFERLVAALADPYAEPEASADLTAPPADHEIVRATFCGT